MDAGGVFALGGRATSFPDTLAMLELLLHLLALLLLAIRVCLVEHEREFGACRHRLRLLYYFIGPP